MKCSARTGPRGQPPTWRRRAARISVARMVCPRAPNSSAASDRTLARFGVALAQQRDDDLLDQSHLPVDGVAVGAQMARLDPVLAELGGQVGHREGVLVEGGDPGHHDRLDQAEALQAGQLDLGKAAGGAELLGGQARPGDHARRQPRLEGPRPQGVPSAAAAARAAAGAGPVGHVPRTLAARDFPAARAARFSLGAAAPVLHRAVLPHPAARPPCGAGGPGAAGGAHGAVRRTGAG